MVPGAIIITPQVLIDRTHPYTAVQTMSLTTANSTTEKSITVPEDTLILHGTVTVHAQDVIGLNYPIVEEDVNRDQYTILIKVTGQADFAEAAMDIFSFNGQCKNPGYQGFILPRNTDVRIQVGHLANGTPQNAVPYNFRIELSGYQIQSRHTIDETRFLSRYQIGKM